MVVLLVKTFSIALVFSFLLSFLHVEIQAYGPVISASSAVLMVASTGEVVYAKNHMEKRGVASTTKILTSIVALENASLYDCVTVSYEDVNVEGTSMGLKAGDTVDLLSLVKGMLLESGNDAANVTATLVSGGTEEFSLLMNKKANQLGMSNSFFKNPSGLTEQGHYSCAYDMALLGSYAINNPIFRSICSLKKAEILKNKDEKITLYNHNKLLSKYEGAFGIKTGFTKASGRCLVSAVEKDGTVLVAVTLNAYDDWNDHAKLYDYYFPLISKKSVNLSLENINIPVINSSKKHLTPTTFSNGFIPYYKVEPQYKIRYFLPRFVYAGVKKGDCLGWVELNDSKGKTIKKFYLVSNQAAPVIKEQNNSCINKNF